MDQVVEMCRLAVADIIASVGGVGNLLKDENKMRLFESIASRLEQLGADVGEVVGPELAQAYSDGIDQADAFLSDDGNIATLTGVNKQMHLAGVQSIVADTMSDMSASYRTAMAMSIENIEGILSSVNQDIAKGMILGDPTDLVSRAVEQTFAKNGMTAFITKDGKHLPLDFYAQTVTRTKTRVAHVDGATNRYKESGVYHVKIGEHSPTCAICARYQGLVVALDPDNAEGFPTDVPLPPYHPNCQHTVRPFVLEYKSDDEIKNERKKWDSFDPDKDPRNSAQKDIYKTEQAIRRKARQEMKDYELLKATAGPDVKVPKTLGAYRRMKRKNDQAWKDLQKAYRENIDIATKPPRATRRSNGKKKDTPKKKDVVVVPKKKKDVPVPEDKKAQDIVDKVSVNTPGINVKLGIGDTNAVKAFDNVIDGLELTDRRKASKHLLDTIDDHNGKIKIKKISANGMVQFTTKSDGTLNMLDFNLRSKDNRSEPHHWKTMFHEFYHAQMHGEKKGSDTFSSLWTKWEETATETSAFYMSDRAGIDTSVIVPSYSEYLVEMLPKLKQMDDFKDAVTLKDFGAKFMKYRFDPDYKTTSWQPLIMEMAEKEIYDIDQNKYFKDHYLEHLKENRERIRDLVIDLFQQDKTDIMGFLRESVDRGFDSGIENGIVNREIRLALPFLMNEIGVKLP